MWKKQKKEQKQTQRNNLKITWSDFAAFIRSCLFANTRTGTVLNFSSSKSSASCLKWKYDKNWMKKKTKALSTVPYGIRPGGTFCQA